MRSENDITSSWNCKKEPLVSVICITYNHEKFIREAIEGFLNQITEFPFEVIIHDDASTDATYRIVREYVEMFPKITRLIFQKKNQHSKGRRILPIVLPHARGKYVALCEGDDFWVDPYKLQKQFDLLDSHPDISMCFHWVDQFNQNSKEIIYPRYGPKSVKDCYTFDDLLKYGNFIGTCSVMFRNRLFIKFPQWFDQIPVGDFPLHLINSRFGNIGFIDECMGVYRVHENGIFGEKSYSQKCQTTLYVYECIGNAFNLWNNHSFHSGILNFKKMLCKAYLSEGKNIKALMTGIDAVTFVKDGSLIYTVDELLRYLSPKIYGKLSSLVFKTSV